MRGGRRIRPPNAAVGLMLAVFAIAAVGNVLRRVQQGDWFLLFADITLLVVVLGCVVAIVWVQRGVPR